MQQKAMPKQERKEYLIRVEGTADSYGIGEIVAPGCTLFAKGMYNLPRDVAEKQAERIHIPFPYLARKQK